MGTKNTGVLLGVVFVIIGAIFYLEHTKQSSSRGVAADLPILAIATTSPAKETRSGAAPTPAAPDRVSAIAAKAKQFDRAKEFVMPSGFLNTPPFKLADTVGKKVILLDFWTYSCINCLRTLPYLTAWDKKYRDQGLLIVGVHTPEFDFEKKYENVSDAVKRLGVLYPVVQDNDYGTWQAYRNQYWPHKYLIDIDGFIVYDHIGEGGYDATEAKIQELLRERNAVLGKTSIVPSGIVPASSTALGAGSPETYFGAARNEYLGNGISHKTGTQDFFVPTDLSSNTLYLGGQWNISDQLAENVKTPNRIVYRYTSRKVFFVASSVNGVRAQVLIDGTPTGVRAGKDVVNGFVTIKEARLYELVSGSDAGEHTIEIVPESAGVQAFTFTFGG